MVLSSAYIHPSPTSSDGHFRYKSFLSNSIQRSNSLASTGSLSSIAEEEEDCYDAYYYSDADESTSPPVVEFCRTSSPSLPPSSDLYVFHEDESRSSSDSSTRSHITPCTPLYAHRLSERLARFTVETLGFPSTPRNSKRFLLAPEYPQPKKRKVETGPISPIWLQPLKSNQKTSINIRPPALLEPASLRRAASLRSDVDHSPRKNRSKDKAPFIRQVVHRKLPPLVSFPPSPALRQQNILETRHRSKAFIVPVIAPPVDHMPMPSLTVDAQAKLRLQYYLDREKAIRSREGFLSTSSMPLNLMRLSKNQWEERLGLEPDLRKEVIEWILELDEPSVPSMKNLCPSPSCEYDERYSRINLMDQLRSSPETKFHAVWMFLRYYHLLHDSRDTTNLKAKDHEVLSIVAWDSGFASLALSVKLHRDVLAPLWPVYSSELEEIAGCSTDYSRLETAQQDLMYSFSYSLGDTPDGILNEIWVALPSLRELLEGVQWWNMVLKITWTQLLKAVLEPDVLRYPVSLLTAAALLQGIRATLISKYEFEEPWNTSVLRQRRDEIDEILEEERRQRADLEAEGVFLDLQEALHISDMALQDCLNWFFEARH